MMSAHLSAWFGLSVLSLRASLEESYTVGSLGMQGGGLHFCPGGYVRQQSNTAIPSSVTSLSTYLLYRFYLCARVLPVRRACALDGVLTGSGVVVALHIDVHFGTMMNAVSFGNVF